MTYDIIERSETVIVVDSDGRSHSFDVQSDDVLSPQSEDVPQDVASWIENNTSYQLTEEQVEFPIRVKCSHHLEDTVGLALARREQRTLDELLTTDNGVNLAGIELHSVWDVYENGDSELSRIEYNGREYTPEDDN